MSFILIKYIILFFLTLFLFNDKRISLIVALRIDESMKQKTFEILSDGT